MKFSIAVHISVLQNICSLFNHIRKLVLIYFDCNLSCNIFVGIAILGLIIDINQKMHVMKLDTQKLHVNAKITLQQNLEEIFAL